MKYVNKKETPLFWHRLYEFLVLPVTLLGCAAVLVNLCLELFGFALFPRFHYLTKALSYLHVSMNQLGSYFWPVVGLTALIVFIFVMMLYTWIGFLHWKRYALYTRFLYLLAIVVTYGAFTYGFIVKNDAVRTVINGFLKNSNYNTVMGNRLLTLYFTLCLGLLIVYFSLNLIYYAKRRMLFRQVPGSGEELPLNDTTSQNEPVQPEPVSPECTQSIPVVEETETITSVAEPETEVTPVEPTSEQEVNLEEPAMETAEEVQTEETIPSPLEVHKSETISEEPQTISEKTAEAEESVVETEKPQETQSDKPAFCPNCGHALSAQDVNFCTHCGTPLH